MRWRNCCNPNNISTSQPHIKSAVLGMAFPQKLTFQVDKNHGIAEMHRFDIGLKDHKCFNGANKMH